MTKDQLKELATHYREAVKAGQAAADAVEDCGTCNMDRATIRLPGTRQTAMADLGMSRFKLRGAFALSCSFGQADKNTKGVKAVSEYLREKGYDTSVWYQMD